jgi:hypothetical protein
MSVESFGFVYLWRDRHRKMFYLGSHHGREDDGYVGSGKRFKVAYRKRPNDFKRRIIARNFVDDPKVTLQLEQYWLNFIKPEELCTRYYNFKPYANGGNTRGRRPHTPESIAKMKARKLSASHKAKIGESNRRRGPRSIETREKISRARTGRKFGPHTVETRLKMSVSRRRRGPHSIETREKMSRARIGRKSGPHTVETKQKIGQGNRDCRFIYKLMTSILNVVNS